MRFEATFTTTLGLTTFSQQTNPTLKDRFSLLSRSGWHFFISGQTGSDWTEQRHIHQIVGLLLNMEIQIFFDIGAQFLRTYFYTIVYKELKTKLLNLVLVMKQVESCFCWYGSFQSIFWRFGADSDLPKNVKKEELHKLRFLKTNAR